MIVRSRIYDEPMHLKSWRTRAIATQSASTADRAEAEIDAQLWSAFLICGVASCAAALLVVYGGLPL